MTHRHPRRTTGPKSARALRDRAAARYGGAVG
jgi:hypothetical protein